MYFNKIKLDLLAKEPQKPKNKEIGAVIDIKEITIRKDR